MSSRSSPELTNARALPSSKGSDSTFGDKYQFAEHLKDLVAVALPKLDIKVLVYPKYETKGDLGESVSRFRSWLEEKVIDIEVAAGTPSPTVEPSVRTVLIGHSMGGIVAAETVISLTTDRPIHYTEDGIEKPDLPDAGEDDKDPLNSLMFPYIQGVLAFDTPYLGISPGLVAHGAEGHYRDAAAAFSQISSLGTSLWGAKQASKPPAKTAGALPPPPSDGGSGGKSGSSSDGSGWGRWGKVAMYAGAAGAVAAGSAAAWMNRDHITEGWTWISSHLEFVGCLARPEELKKRIAYMVRVNRELDVGFANLYTRLGKDAGARQPGVAGTVLGTDRTFCNIPKHSSSGLWKAAVNTKAKDETTAHTSKSERHG
jgi:hypothetical protein